MFSEPTLTSRHALFLDFDGTLADIAEQPHQVTLPRGTLQDLRALQQALGGALAIVTGRAHASIAPHFAGLALPLACEHGARLHPAGTAPDSAPSTPSTDSAALAAVRPALRALARQHPALLLEEKNAAIALHYRHAPELQALCRQTLEQALAGHPGLELLAGKCVYEVKPAGASKGRAIKRLMHEPPFAGRVPLFVGDDVTDEAGFAAVQALGGLGVKVGAGGSAARARLDSPPAVRAWLHTAARTLAPTAETAR